MSEILRQLVWAKAKDGPFGSKIDEYGNIMQWSEYGNAASPFGWELDHHPIPKALGGLDVVTNMRALNCKQNRSNGGLLANALRQANANPFRVAPPRGIFGSSYRSR